MYKLVTLIAGTMVATAAIGQGMMTTTRHTTVTRTTTHRHMTNVPVGGITLARAERIATNARPGRILSHRIDQERGGPAYSFNIRSHGRRYEVDVNRRTGRIVENRLIGRA